MRRFDWISSSTGEPARLEQLAQRMENYYAERPARFYADWLERACEGAAVESGGESETSVRAALTRYICGLAPGAVLEVGCADGTQYRDLIRHGFGGSYTGTDVTAAAVEANRRDLPAARWEVASTYALPFEDGTFDVCLASFVLEHLVYPERGLLELLRVVKRSGRLVLLFPDFVAKKRLNSQALGLSVSERVAEKLRRGRVLDAAVSLYDSRFRLPKALREMPRRVGPFPVNTRPLCLSHRDVFRSDIDAVYIASKREVAGWATRLGHAVEFPYGTGGPFSDIAFLAIVKA